MLRHRRRASLKGTRMAGTDYDGFEAIFRIIAAGEEPETFAIEVITFHAAVEYELGIVLHKLLPNPDKILTGKPKLSFPHKAKLLEALWQKDQADADKLGAVLRALQDLRDAVAHKDNIPLKSHKANLSQAFRGIEPSSGDDPSMMEIAQGICVFMADDIGTLAEAKKTMSGLNEIVNVKMPTALGRKHHADDGNAK